VGNDAAAISVLAKMQLNLSELLPTVKGKNIYLSSSAEPERKTSSQKLLYYRNKQVGKCGLVFSSLT